MSLSWRGHGYLGFMIPLVCMALAVSIGGINNMQAMRLAMCVAATAVWLGGKRLNAAAYQAGQEPAHEAFGQPMERSIAIPIVGFVLTFM